MASLLEHLSKDRLEDILNRCAIQTIGVVGDLGLDAYWYADMTRSFLSRETPRFPRPVMREAYSPGAGANVAQNLAALGVEQVIALSVLGDDWRGEILRHEMASRGITVDHVIVSPEWSTTTFIKPILLGYDAQQEDARLDFENANPLSPALEQRLIDLVTGQLPDLDALLVADQLDVNGIITDRVREALNELAAGYPDTYFVVDSRQNIGLFRHMVLKPNWIEATAAVDPDRDLRSREKDELTEIGEMLRQRSGRPIFITLSEDGVLIFSEGAHRHLPIAYVRPPLDPVGAGDTFIAALAASLAAGATPWEAGAIATLGTGVTVEKLGQTGTASPEEILDRYDLTAREEKAT